MKAGTLGSPWNAEVTAFKQRLLTEALRRHRGNRMRTARALGLSKAQVQKLIRAWGINVPWQSWGEG